MRIAMIGAGYVGLVSGACFADFGHDVVCIDSDADKIAALTRGELPIYEPGLQSIVSANAAAGRLRFSGDLARGVEGAEIVFIAVGTPSRRGDGHADLSFVHAAAHEVAHAIDGFAVIVTKSTVPVGTGDEVERIMREANPAADFAVVSNPEFLREGSAIEDFRRPDRIIVGTGDQRARTLMAQVYRPLYLNEAPIMFTSRRSAELTKYGANAFLAMKIAFINEMADLCEAAGANVQDVARGLGLDRRIGPKFLNAGPGFGGSCFPKDTQALVKTGQDFGVPLRLVETTVAINEARKRRMGRKVIAAMGGDVRGKTVAVLGLTFKPNTDDLREAPALSIIQSLQDAGAKVRAFDPKGMPGAQPLLPDVVFCEDAYDAATGADGLAIVTEWNVFRSLDLKRLKGLMAAPVLIDLRNIYRRREVEAEGFAYEGVGTLAPGDADLFAEAAE